MRVQSSRTLVFCVGAWAAKVNDQNQWIQADLKLAHIIESVTTQGRPQGWRSSHNQFVKSYKVSYSQDGTNWVELPDLYVGNSNRDGKKTNSLPDNTEARLIRLHPIEWHGHISMRWEVTGCREDHGKVPLVTECSFCCSQRNVHTQKVWTLFYRAFIAVHVVKSGRHFVQ